MHDSPIRLTGVELAPWQREAVESWTRGDGRSPYRGTLEIFTGGGKTLIALACVARAAEVTPNLKVAIVVPSEALARQWQKVLLSHTNLDPADIGVMGAGKSDEFGLLGTGPRVLVAVINTAAKRLRDTVFHPSETMLIVDECHRAGSRYFSKVLATPARFRLGLSATPDREELDEDGEPVSYDEQLVGQSLGKVVVRWMLRDARAIGWLPSFEIHHHGITLHPDERAEYEAMSRRVDEAGDRLRELGFESGRAQHLRGRPGEIGQAAQAYVAATTARKDLLYHARERHRLTVDIVSRLFAENLDRRVLLFHERIDEAVALYDDLVETMARIATPSETAVGGLGVVRIEHSRMPTARRTAAMDAFRDGTARILVSVKSLVEGIDVPAADVGISVASSSSVRQRIQSLGRVLRRQFDHPEDKQAQMHVIYVADTVDEVIYGKQDWSDLTGDGTNRYWLWSLDPAAPPTEQDGPPRTPKPTEEMEWQRLGETAPTAPKPWLGMVTGQEYSLDTMGTVTNMSGSVITNPQGVAEMVRAVRGRAGGRFRVTPIYRLVLVGGDGPEGGYQLYVAGQLSAPFDAVSFDELVNVGENVAVAEPGQPLRTVADKKNGSFQLRQRMGGLIERKVPQGGTEFADVGPDAEPGLAANGRLVLDTWQKLVGRGVKFFVNSSFDAWYLEAGVPIFLAKVPGGFAWPQANEGSQ